MLEERKKQMKKYFKYLGYVLRHKWFVLLECIRLGIIWRGIFHDLSKFLPSEFIPYARYFYGKKGKNISRGRDKTGYYSAGSTGKASFDYAWLLHQKRNPHHWQWWILPKDDGSTKTFPMPVNVIKEMLCDWRGAQRAQRSKWGVSEWYEKNKGKMKLDFLTEASVVVLIKKFF